MLFNLKHQTTAFVALMATTIQSHCRTGGVSLILHFFYGHQLTLTDHKPLISEPIKDILKLLDKASHSANRRSLGFSAAEIAYGLMHVATNDGNKRMVRHYFSTLTNNRKQLQQDNLC